MIKETRTIHIWFLAVVLCGLLSFASSIVWLKVIFLVLLLFLWVITNIHCHTLKDDVKFYKSKYVEKLDKTLAAEQEIKIYKDAIEKFNVPEDLKLYINFMQRALQNVFDKSKQR